MRKILPLLLALTLLPGIALAKKKKPAGTDQAAQKEQILTTHRAYTQAVKGNDWAEAAKYFEPAALSGIRETMAPVFAMDAGDGDGKSVAEMMTGHTSDALAELDDAGFFGAFMTGVIAMNPGLSQVMAESTMTEKGVAFGEGGDAYVVYEMTVVSNGMSVGKYAVTPMARAADGNWGLQMTGEIKGMAEMLSRLAADEKARAEAAAAEGADAPPAEDAVPADAQTQPDDSEQPEAKE
ncbi:MAG: hypothetical protein KDA24_26190 [Deltaproteobacteria bacterium]|nr:hypothetical protein [Deltaproteobacteria bacterium]